VFMLFVVDVLPVAQNYSKVTLVTILNLYNFTNCELGGPQKSSDLCGELLVTENVLGAGTCFYGSGGKICNPFDCVTCDYTYKNTSEVALNIGSYQHLIETQTEICNGTAENSKTCITQFINGFQSKEIYCDPNACSYTYSWNPVNLVWLMIIIPLALLIPYVIKQTFCKH